MISSEPILTMTSFLLTPPLEAGTKLWGFQRGRASPLVKGGVKSPPTKWLRLMTKRRSIGTGSQVSQPYEVAPRHGNNPKLNKLPLTVKDGRRFTRILPTFTPGLAATDWALDLGMGIGATRDFSFASVF